jgi:hypothetical protein
MKLMELAHPLRHGAKVLFNDDADALIADLVEYLDQQHLKYHDLY